MPQRLHGFSPANSHRERKRNAHHLVDLPRTDIQCQRHVERIVFLWRVDHDQQYMLDLHTTGQHVRRHQSFPGQ